MSPEQVVRIEQYIQGVTMRSDKFKAEASKHIAVLEEQARFMAYGPLSSMKAESQCGQLIDSATASIDAAILAIKVAVSACGDKEFAP